MLGTHWHDAMVQPLSNLTEFPRVPFLYQGNGYGTRPEVFNFRTPPLAVHAACRLEEVWLG